MTTKKTKPKSKTEDIVYKHFVGMLLSKAELLLKPENITFLIQSFLEGDLLYWRTPTGYVSINIEDQKILKLGEDLTLVGDGSTTKEEVVITAHAIELFIHKSLRFREAQEKRQLFSFRRPKQTNPAPTETECYQDSALNYLPQLLTISAKIYPEIETHKISDTVFQLPNNKILTLSFPNGLVNSIVEIMCPPTGYKDEDNTKEEKIKALEYLLSLKNPKAIKMVKPKNRREK